MNKKIGLKKEEQKIIINVLKKFPGVEQALIFGSRALGNFKPGSDVDLVLKGKVEEIYLDIKSILNEETMLPYNFDVLVYKNIRNKKLKDHINNYGKVIYNPKVSRKVKFISGGKNQISKVL